MQIRIALERNARKSRVWLEGVEITRYVRGFVLSGDVDSRSEIRLTLTGAAVEIEGEVGRVLTEPATEAVD